MLACRMEALIGVLNSGENKMEIIFFVIVFTIWVFSQFGLFLALLNKKDLPPVYGDPCDCRPDRDGTDNEPNFYKKN